MKAEQIKINYCEMTATCRSCGVDERTSTATLDDIDICDLAEAAEIQLGWTDGECKYCAIKNN